MAPMTDEQIKILIENVATKIAEHYFGIMKDYIGKEMTLHVAQCAASKYGWAKSVAAAIAGGTVTGIIVAFVSWRMTKGG